MKTLGIIGFCVAAITATGFIEGNATPKDYERATLAYLETRNDIAITDIDRNSKGECYLWFDVEKEQVWSEAKGFYYASNWVCVVSPKLNVECGFPNPGDTDY